MSEYNGFSINFKSPWELKYSNYKHFPGGEYRIEDKKGDLIIGRALNGEEPDEWTEELDIALEKMAAAPELLEALQDMKKVCQCIINDRDHRTLTFGDFVQIKKMAEEALEKTEGDNND